MAMKRRRCLGLTRLVAILLMVSPAAYGSAFNVVMNSGSLNAMDVILAFDFIDGGLPSNTVDLSTLTSNGTQGASSTSGDVTVTGTGWTFGDTSFINELLVDFTPLGTSLAFSFTTTDNPPDQSQGSSPDAFFFSILDPNNCFDPSDPSTCSPFPTDDPIPLQDALFEFDIGGGGAAPCHLDLCVYSPDPAIRGFSLTVTPVAAVPEPGTLGLLAVGFGALFARRRLK